MTITTEQLRETLTEREVARIAAAIAAAVVAALKPGDVLPNGLVVVEAKQDGFAELISAARIEAGKAMRKFPQPNYVISKVAEEAGEVVKAAIHCAENRETAENVAGEMKQLIAMLYRLWVEGDQVHGLKPISGLGLPEPERPWISWHGGENPLPGKVVEVKLRSGHVITGKNFQWEHNETCDHIIAYREARS